MNSAFLLASALWLVAQAVPPSTLPVPTVGPLRETFVTAAETVLDDAAAVDIKGDNDHFSGQFQQLKVANDNLSSMASEEREKSIAASTKDLAFQISSCHIQAIDGADTTKCQAQVDHARNRAMEALNKHKSGNAWVDGPPA
jgi:hypothetical protein